MGQEKISRRWAVGESGREIAWSLDRHDSVVNREVAAGGGRAGYRAVESDRRAVMCRPRPKLRRVEVDTWLLARVNAGLAQKWSPRQISRRLLLVVDFPGDDTMRVSHEQRYEALYVQRDRLTVVLASVLRRGGTTRVGRASWRRIAESKSRSSRRW
ncbi:hypothetical protein [Nocardia sp. CNY236]|uniref:hypothetical protein n=1 Tax=Nocardia sp. CNY236 TaxID=1169152 RepID=UPI0004097603|nr:hypothetical protein [Nocardia sp. CNY236]